MEVFGIIVVVTALIFLLIIRVVLISAKRGLLRKKSAKELGEEGEHIVASILGGTVDGKQYLINNLVITDENGHSSQIDHIFINKLGIWVIETKNYSGKIYGKEKDEKWLQVLADGRDRHYFYNPVKQNTTHIYRLKGIIGTKSPVYSAIVFTKADISNIRARNVYPVSMLKNVVWSYGGECLTVEQMREFYGKILNIKNSNTVSEKKHIENVHKTLSDIANGVCPRCGGKLIERTGYRGKFYGCSNYPKCKFTKNI